MAKEIYEILGRPVTKEQYEAASKKMDAPQSEVEKKWMILLNAQESGQSKENLQ
jgi:hypothetical protein